MAQETNGALLALGVVGAVAAAGAVMGGRGSMAQRQPQEIMCPGCGQPLDTSQGFSECGGEGEGICADSVFAFDAKSKGDKYANEEWLNMWGATKTPPSKGKQKAIIAAHEAIIAAHKAT